MYMRAPMGLSSSSDEFCRRSDRILEGVSGAFKIVDDVIISAENLTELYLKIEKILNNCKLYGITLSKEKMVISNSVSFAGLIISDEGVRPDPSKLNAMKNFPVPKNITDLRSFFGMANQIRQFVPNMADICAPISHLLKPNNAFVWTDHHSEAFVLIKEELVKPFLLHHFDPKRKTFLLTDASRLNGLGFALIQEDEDGKKYLITCGSRNISDPERRYAPIEIEAVAITWAILKCRLYLLGGDFTVVTDHRPLVGVFTKRDTENTRLRRCLDKIAPYNFDVTWVQGKTHKIADALSRAPILPHEDGDLVLVRRISGGTTRLLKESAETDEDYVAVREYFIRGDDINKINERHPARQFLNIWHAICVQDGLLYYDEKIIIPGNYRKKIMELLHTAHIGLERTLKKARETYYWPGMSSDIKNLIDGCQPCQTLRRSKMNDYTTETVATAPMEQMSMDLFHYGSKEYFVLVDRYSGYPFVEYLPKTSTSDVLKRLDKIFQHFGYPKRIRSDGGPQFRSEFEEYCEDHNIVHETSSPYYPESNGHAEAAVKNMKHLLEKCGGSWDKFNEALLEWRNMPKANKASPHELMFGRGGNTNLPVAPLNLPKFNIGDEVLVQNPKNKRWDRRGIILRIRDSNKSFEIKVDDKIIIRNQKYLHLAISANEDSPNSSSGDGGADEETPKTPRRSPRLNS